MKSTPIQLLVKGETRTLLDTELANDAISLLNKLQRLEIRTAKQGTSSLDVSGENAILTLTRTDLGRVLGSAALLNITISEDEPTDDQGEDGDLWVVA